MTQTDEMLVKQLTDFDFDSLCNEDERNVAMELFWGRSRAMTVPQIAELAGLPSRRVQEIIQHLLLEHALPIGTAMSRPYGNYFIDRSVDLDETVDLLRARGISHLARAAALRRIPLRQFLEAVQTSLDLDTWDSRSTAAREN